MRESEDVAKASGQVGRGGSEPVTVFTAARGNAKAGADSRTSVARLRRVDSPRRYRAQSGRNTSARS